MTLAVKFAEQGPNDGATEFDAPLPGDPVQLLDDNGFAEWLEQARQPLTATIQRYLVDMLYSHRSPLRPTQIRQVITDEINHLLAHSQGGDKAMVYERAKQLVEIGLSCQALLAISRLVNEFCYTHCERDLLIDYVSKISHYFEGILESFIEIREEVILAEQEHIRSALQKSFSRYYNWLNAAADVSRAVTSTLDLRHLISQAVDLIRSHFDHYHVALYLVDKSAHYAILRASSGRGEAKIQIEGQKVRIDEQTLVGTCALKREARTIANTNADTIKQDKTLLPETRSLMLLPLVSRRQIIGVLVVHSENLSAFYDDDITRLQTIADQLANAIENARLYHELQLHSQDLAQAVELRTLELQKTTEKVETILENSPDAILLLNENSEIVLVNPAALNIFACDTEAIIGKTLEDLLLPDQVEQMSDLLEKCRLNSQSRGLGFVARRFDGKTFDAGIALATISEMKVITGLVCIIRDITEQVRTEEKIRASLREKEVLLQEIHHRVKNNMQVISSLIALQAGYTDDAHVHQMFHESQSRIRSMALVHEQLYRSHDLARIDFSKYIHELSSNLMRSYPNAAGRIELELDADAIFLDIDTAIPCGLIINELVSNAFKHAFPNGREGRISLTFKKDLTNRRTLIVRDNGIGFPTDFNVYRTETLGMQLVTSLTAQLNATIGLRQDQGTTFEIRFAIEAEDDQSTSRLPKTGVLTERHDGVSTTLTAAQNK